MTQTVNNEYWEDKIYLNLHFKQGTGETYKDKILKLIKRETEKI
ncbi:hypothetical protein [Histophilus somni]